LRSGHPEPPAPPPHADRSSPTWFAGISILLAAGAVLHALRIAVILLERRPYPSPSDEFVRWHVAIAAIPNLAVSLAAGAIGTAIAFALGRRALAATVLAGAVFLVPLSGAWFDDPAYVPDTVSRRGQAVLAVLALLALVLAHVLVRLVRALRSAPSTSAALVGPAAWSISALAVAAVPGAAWVLLGREPPVHRASDVVREILLDPTSWTVVSGPDDRPPRVGTITPTLDWTLDGGDLPALVMPPPCEVRFEVRPEDGPVLLRTSAGVDHGILDQLLRAPPDCAVVFELEVNGVRRFAARVPTRAPDVDRVWRHAGGAQGLALSPGDRVTLRTSMSPDGFEVTSRRELTVGFGRLELERVVQRPFVRPSEERPSIVLVVMDTLRADELSCYGNRAHTTPALDALAARGLLHERAYATSSWTWPSTVSILTGLWPEAHGVVSQFHCYLDHRLDTLAEVLGRENFATAAFACNPLLDPSKGFAQGFEVYDYSRQFRTSEAVLWDIESWIVRHAEARFFLYLHLIDPHRPVHARPEDFERVGASPVAPPGSPKDPLVDGSRQLEEVGAITEGGNVDPDLVIPPERQRWIRDSYSAGVLSADYYVGEVLRALEEQGLADTTLVVFTSDHGEELFDHGHLGHGHSLHQELVRVPLILAGPGVPRGERARVPVSNIALFETLAKCGGALIPRGVETGEAPVDLRSGGDADERTLFFSTESGWWWNRPQSPFYACQDGTWVLHVAPRALPWGVPRNSDPGEGQIRLYELASDPGELVDRAAEKPDIVRALRERWAEHLEAQAALRMDRMPGAGEATLDLLRRFGYTGEGK